MNKCLTTLSPTVFTLRNFVAWQLTNARLEIYRLRSFKRKAIRKKSYNTSVADDNNNNQLQ